MEKVPQGDKGKARDKAGEAVGVSGRYVSDAKKIHQAAPDLETEIFDR